MYTANRPKASTKQAKPQGLRARPPLAVKRSDQNSVSPNSSIQETEHKITIIKDDGDSQIMESPNPSIINSFLKFNSSRMEDQSFTRLGLGDSFSLKLDFDDKEILKENQDVGNLKKRITEKFNVKLEKVLEEFKRKEDYFMGIINTLKMKNCDLLDMIQMENEGKMKKKAQPNGTGVDQQENELLKKKIKELQERETKILQECLKKEKMLEEKYKKETKIWQEKIQNEMKSILASQATMETKAGELRERVRLEVKKELEQEWKRERAIKDKKDKAKEIEQIKAIVKKQLEKKQAILEENAQAKIQLQVEDVKEQLERGFKNKEMEMTKKQNELERLLNQAKRKCIESERRAASSNGYNRFTLEQVNKLKRDLQANFDKKEEKYKTIIDSLGEKMKKVQENVRTYFKQLESYKKKERNIKQIELKLSQKERELSKRAEEMRKKQEDFDKKRRENTQSNNKNHLTTPTRSYQIGEDPTFGSKMTELSNRMQDTCSFGRKESFHASVNRQHHSNTKVLTNLSERKIQSREKRVIINEKPKPFLGKNKQKKVEIMEQRDLRHEGHQNHHNSEKSLIENTRQRGIRPLSAVPVESTVDLKANMPVEESIQSVDPQELDQRCEQNPYLNRAIYTKRSREVLQKIQSDQNSQPREHNLSRERAQNFRRRAPECQTDRVHSKPPVHSQKMSKPYSAKKPKISNNSRNGHKRTQSFDPPEDLNIFKKNTQSVNNLPQGIEDLIKKPKLTYQASPVGSNSKPKPRTPNKLSKSSKKRLSYKGLFQNIEPGFKTPEMSKEKMMIKEGLEGPQNSSRCNSLYDQILKLQENDAPLVQDMKRMRRKLIAIEEEDSSLIPEYAQKIEFLASEKYLKLLKGYLHKNDQSGSEGVLTPEEIREIQDNFREIEKLWDETYISFAKRMILLNSLSDIGLRDCVPVKQKFKEFTTYLSVEINYLESDRDINKELYDMIGHRETVKKEMVKTARGYGHGSSVKTLHQLLVPSYKTLRSLNHQIDTKVVEMLRAGLMSAKESVNVMGVKLRELAVVEKWEMEYLANLAESE